MALIFSSNIVLSPTVTLNDNAGLIAWQNRVTSANVTATSELISAPITNVSNPATAFGWHAETTATQTITITLDGQEIDFVGIAKHNLNQIGLTVDVRLNGVSVLFSSNFTEQAILFVLNTASPSTVEIVISGATVAPKIAVVYVGKAMKLERNIYVGHTPMNYGRNRSAINGVSENGQYLGEIVVRESRQTSVQLQNLTPAWYRSTLDPFFAAKPRQPCFFAWRPASYPDEVSYCWIEGDPTVSNQRSNGMMQASWNFRGIA